MITGPAYQLVRLNYDGSLDTGFTHWGAPNGYITGIKIVSDPIFGNNNVRLFCTYPKNQDGSGGNYYFLLLNSNVNIPSISNPPIAFLGSETVDGPIFNMAMQNNDGKWVIGGQFKNVFGTSSEPHRPAHLRFGRCLDPGLSAMTSAVGPNGVVTGISPMMTTSPY